METIIFKDANFEVSQTRANYWLDNNSKYIVVVNIVSFLDRIDEKNTVVISYHS